jgi:hypothetical protein
MEETTPTLPFVAEYGLTDEAFKRQKAITPDIEKRQCAIVYLNRKEAVKTGYAQEVNKSYFITDNFPLCKLEPDLTRIGVIRNLPIPAFDYILSVKEATEMVEREMARYDDVLAVSRAAYDKRANTNTGMVTLTGTYTLTEEAHRELFLAGTPTTREQTINVTVDAQRTLRAEYLYLDRNGKASPARSSSGLFSKLTPANERILRETNVPPEFDHVLTTEEATKLVISEMDRYDDALIERMEEEIDDLIKKLEHYPPEIKNLEGFHSYQEAPFAPDDWVRLLSYHSPTRHILCYSAHRCVIRPQ